jgi:hypothetical protein
MTFLLELPAWVSFIIVAVVSVAASIAGLKLVRRKIPHESLRENHEVAGFIFNAFGLIYAVLIAFVVFVSWSDYTDSKRNTEIEANLAADLFLDAQGLPDTLKTKVRSAIIEYTSEVINNEWDEMKNGNVSINAREKIEMLWHVYLNTDVKQLHNVPIYQESLRRLNDLGEYRRLRIISSNDFIPGVIWFVLITCAMVSVGYTFFFGSKNIRPQYVMTAVLALINALILLLIYILDHPFQGSNRVGSFAFQHILSYMQHLMGGG